ncbi:carboxypeptidase-like regulatory domain-containing protein [Janthinobacterium sp. Mn2066]|uniref:carboxypeptidase-like regulatory domain-containing protein n=1 Tax=Janthinobacterium sp. Mn2066 TaxID=3395264 RepID=UPI003BCE4EDD
MILRKISLFPAVCLALVAQTAAAAETGQIEGHARPGEQIVIINEKTGAISGVVADDQGHFEAARMAPGQYQVVYQGVPRHSSGAPVIAGRTTVVGEQAGGQASR